MTVSLACNNFEEHLKRLDKFYLNTRKPVYNWLDSFFVILVETSRLSSNGFESSNPTTILLIETMSDLMWDALGDKKLDKILNMLQNNESKEKHKVGHGRAVQQASSVTSNKEQIYCSLTTFVPTRRIRLSSSSIAIEMPVPFSLT